MVLSSTWWIMDEEYTIICLEMSEYKYWLLTSFYCGFFTRSVLHFLQQIPLSLIFKTRGLILKDICWTQEHTCWSPARHRCWLDWPRQWWGCRRVSWGRGPRTWARAFSNTERDPCHRSPWETCRLCRNHLPRRKFLWEVPLREMLTPPPPNQTQSLEHASHCLWHLLPSLNNAHCCTTSWASFIYVFFHKDVTSPPNHIWCMPCLQPP